MGLATYWAARLAPAGLGAEDMEDLIGAGLLGVARALARADEARGEAGFRQFVTAHVRGAILEEVREAGRFKRAHFRELMAEAAELPLPLQPPLSLETLRTSEEASGEDVTGGVDPLELVLAAVLRQEVRRWVDRLPARERYVVEEAILGERTYPAIARDMGISPSRVSQLWYQARARLRTWMREEEL